MLTLGLSSIPLSCPTLAVYRALISLKAEPIAALAIMLRTVANSLAFRKGIIVNTFNPTLYPSLIRERKLVAYTKSNLEI